MLVAVAVAAEPIARILLNDSGELQQAVIILAVGATGVTGLVMHRSFGLVASGDESQLRRASLPGAAVVTAVCIAAALVGGFDGAFVAVSGYLAGLCVTLVLIERNAPQRRPADTVLACCALIALPAIAAVAALEEELRVALAVVVFCGIVAAAAWLLLKRPRGHEADSYMASAERNPS